MADFEVKKDSAEWWKIYEKVNSISPIPIEIWRQAGLVYSIRDLSYGDFLIRQGKVPTEFAFVFSGVLREYYLTSDGNEYIKSFNFPGEFTGSYFDLLSGQPSTCNIRAITDCKIAVANFSELASLYETHIAWERLGRIVAENLFLKKAKREYELLALNAEERYELLKTTYPNIEELIPQYHIASYLGITPVSLSRIRSKTSKQKG
ncbi:Crp/Fnr family transcriptional regulator [Leptospira yasudae]|uniref:Crp/Fnr family transcriptional regulator n=1 Tax=Leptospira yasudae TaxID=2202201 RepID=A0A6N4QXC4_9LEPT|nr:Crp/Fnr family transcriptional regulator [Leptospira yasudae]TGL82085.1 Crp/Fnr family transcriptional regulator [Leptospira yasudae]TGL83182.1 Crp/Fnr family transcriptional regulator [Leptospira yasudae]TGL87442.1 Crp/Fnr family transcriptional regulator [Leptospira yasudae]